ncbi:facilitated trehalose transporter Tret1-2 homolog isoform X2 [Oratosquilla oratoria]|uniref:facilitated trehalose transporter Tret1-2 homolog isoform X2 n=1 Tax=Oratosquilla oratoria TaxID=337810 RepID=UPI003F763E31
MVLKKVYGRPEGKYLEEEDKSMYKQPDDLGSQYGSQYGSQFAMKATESLKQVSEASSFITEEDLPPRKGCHASAFLRQLVAVIVVCASGAGTGTIFAYSAVAVPQWNGVDSHLNLTKAEAKWFSSVPVMVSVPACCAAGFLLEVLGPRLCVLSVAPVLGITWIVIAYAHASWQLMVARGVQGVLMSIISVTITVYPVEVASSRLRGVLMSLTETTVMTGVLITYSLGLVLEPSHLALAFASCLVIQFIGIYNVPDSPMWLAKKGRLEEAQAALEWLNGKKSTASEIKDMVALSSVQNSDDATSMKAQLKSLKTVNMLKSLVILNLILLFKELTGQYAITAYAVRIFQMAGTTLDPYWCTFYMGIARALPCVLNWLLIERVPRKVFFVTFLLLSSAGIGVIGIYMLVLEQGIYPDLPEYFGWVPLSGMLFFITCFSIGVGATSWVLVAEIMPSSIRNIGSGITNTLFCAYQFIIVVTFPDLVEVAGSGGAFLFYASCGVVGSVFILAAVPETRGLSLESIQNRMNKEPAVKTNKIGDSTISIA